MAPHSYTPEEVAFLKANIRGTSRRDLTDLFNARFGLALSVDQVVGACKNRGLTNGRDGRFGPGHVPANKGIKGVGGWAPTQFPKGHRPHNKQEVGDERVNTLGYVDIKIAEPNKWRGKHLVLWERENGPLPKGFAIIFADGDNRNFALENLLLVSRKELAYLNRNRLIRGNAELTQTALTVARIAQKAAARELENINRVESQGGANV